jgi:hypothetical protein
LLSTGAAVFLSRGGLRPVSNPGSTAPTMKGKFTRYLDDARTPTAVRAFSR